MIICVNWTGNWDEKTINLSRFVMVNVLWSSKMKTRWIIILKYAVVHGNML
jgi:hypothetical protein